MDHETHELQPIRTGSVGRLSNASSSRRRSLILSLAIESESVSEAGDIGDRALHRNRCSSLSGRSQFSLDFNLENGSVFPIQDDPSLFTSLPLENTFPLSTDAIIQFGDGNKVEREVPWLLEYITCLLSLAVFGILGVLARYGLRKLFGPPVISATSDQSYIYLDNMVGSFLMGWLGVVFERDISDVSDKLAIGLTVGFLGSFTSFSGWNQKMLNLTVKGQWVFGLHGILLGLFLAAYSIVFGIETAKGFKWLLHKRSNKRFLCGITTCMLNRFQCLLTFMVMLLLFLGLLWGVFCVLEKRVFETGGSEAELYLACLVGPFGVWMRWFLARFNGRGLGKNDTLKWIPFGTLAANVLSASAMAALATLKKAVNTKTCDTVSNGIQFGLLGCLSSVSGFIAEFHALRESIHPWRAYAYATVTFLVSFISGTLIYSAPVWVRGYDKMRGIMDHETRELQPMRSGSFGRVSSASSSRRRSLNLSFAAIESESVSEAGDIGDRALHSNRCSISGRSHFSFDNNLENGIIFPIQDEPSLNTSLPLENISPLSTDAIFQSTDGKKVEREVPWLLEYITCLLSLAVFGVLGVLARYCLQKLFGPEVIGATSDHSYMYLDLPSNMVGSFLMGWLGVVFKGDISKVSDQLAIGLTTGFLGSLTTFSGWNQKMLDLSVKGQWVFAVLGILIGLFLAAYSIVFGIETAKGFKWLIRKRSNKRFICGITTCISNRFQCLLTFMVMLLLMLGLLWGTFGGLEKRVFETGGSEAELYLACLVGPFGVWMRWLLARLNGRGLGKNDTVKWIPFGTLAANVLAACVMAALATVKKAVNTKTCDTVVNGIQFGLLGCLSTVSTFVAEFHAMRESIHPWRAYAYATITFLISFILGTLIYSVPVWARGYDE
ncbi:hypothetical protein ACJIZ3_020934 [Penstemon smallii]|uniref:Uncharacterized protein n=1 Tax=Penstemon smallii TaxID=265156 RepID=A0ABD3SKL6_9LAMI